MGKRSNLLKLFTQDVTYNYHVVKTEEPNGHLIYLIKGDSPIEQDTLEFSATKIVEELIENCGVKVEKFAPAIFFTEEDNTEKLKYQLNDKLSENSEFSTFIDTIKDEYRILEVKDSLLYKKDPEAYDEAKRQEKAEHQKELFDQLVKQMEEQKKHREEHILKYDNNIMKLMKEYFEGIIEYEREDFDFYPEFEKLINNLIDQESWIKIDDKPFVCKIKILSLEKDKINVLLSNNIDSYTATLRFDKTVLVTENALKIEDTPKTLNDYDILSILYDVDFSTVPDWEFKSHTEKFEYVIGYLVPIFKAEKERKEKEYVDKVLKEEEKEEFVDFEEELLGKEDDCDDMDGLDDHEKIDELVKRGLLKELEIDNLEEHNKQFKNNNKNVKKTRPSDWYFDVFVPEDMEEMNPAVIALSEDGSGTLDDSLGSHSLSQNIIDALKRAGIFGDCEMMEAIWEVNDCESKTKESIIKDMESEGFIYVKHMLGDFDLGM